MMRKNKKDDDPIMKELNQILHVMIFIIIVAVLADVAIQLFG